MRKFAVYILTTLLSFPLYAEDINIDNWDKKTGGSGNTGGSGIEHDKELVLDLRASIDDGVITLNTSLSTWGVTVTIYNGDEVPVYCSTSMDEGVTHQFYVGTLPADNYTLEIQIGDSAFSGEFTID